MKGIAPVIFLANILFCYTFVLDWKEVSDTTSRFDDRSDSLDELFVNLKNTSEPGLKQLIGMSYKIFLRTLLKT